MGFGNITTDDKGITVYAKEKNGRNGAYKTYSTKISAKDTSGNWTSCFVNLGFKKGVSLNNKAVIKIKNAFPTPSKWGESYVLKIFVMDFEILEEGEKPVETPDASADFMNIADGMNVDLPFE